jgi:hypothetical protein
MLDIFLCNNIVTWDSMAKRENSHFDSKWLCFIINFSVCL